MISGIASLTFIPLLAMALVHMLWAFGATYPARDEETLAKTVVGMKGVTTMPPRLVSFSLSLFFFAAGIWALALTDPGHSSVLDVGGIGLAMVFLMRGAVGLSAPWREKMSEEPFATFNRKLYSPLCLLIGTGFSILTILRLL